MLIRNSKGRSHIDLNGLFSDAIKGLNVFGAKVVKTKRTLCNQMPQIRRDINGNNINS